MARLRLLRGGRKGLFGALFALMLGLAGLAVPAGAQTLPVVAVLDSENTRALSSLAASNGTPSGLGTSGTQWWLTNWNYHVMPAAAEEMMRSDGTAFAVVGDSNIVNGALLSNGIPVYPIVISLANEAILDSEVAPLTNYVAAGGYLFVGSSSFTRFTNGATRTNFALAGAMGVTMVNQALTNWGINSTFTKQYNHRIVTHIPAGTLQWAIPSAAEEITWGVSPNHVNMLPHLVWQVQATDASVVAQGDNYPFLLVKQYGKGCFIYCAAIEPILGHSGWDPGMYSYAIFRKSIEWAFGSFKMPVPKISPWPYQYDAAFMMRHDLENYSDEIAHLLDSAQYEKSNGVLGDYYFCTGQLREVMGGLGYNTNLIISNLLTAVTNSGATIGAHNGGFKNQNNLTLASTNYDYFHWGTDETLIITNAITNNSIVYSNGKAYALASLSNAVKDIETWGLATSAMRELASPYFNATKEDSIDIQTQLGVKISGDQKLSPFPSWTFSTLTPGKQYSMLNIPVSDWYIPGQPTIVGQAMDNPVAHTTNSVHQMIDFYYGTGGLINLYSHTLSQSSVTNATLPGPGGALPQEYIRYGMNTNLHPRLWPANATNIYNWWLQRSNTQFSASFSNSIAGVSTVNLTISNSISTNSSVELLLPGLGVLSGLQVKTNGAAATTNFYRLNGQVLKLRVGTSVTNAVISYSLAASAQNDYYSTPTGTPLSVAAPGVLGNDTPGTGGTTLTASLVAGPTNGSLTLNSDGSFTYTPTNAATLDSFNYTASDGQSTSASATVEIFITPNNFLFYDDFNRAANADPLVPWQVPLYYGAWTNTNAALRGTGDVGHYAYAYISNVWANYSVQSLLQFPVGAFGGGIGGQLNPVTGAHYGAWIYPETSPSTGNAQTLQLLKFNGWNSFTNMATVNLAGLGLSVGTNAHTLKMQFVGSQVSVYLDGAQLISMTDTSSPYTNGCIDAELFGLFTLAFDNFIASSNAIPPVANGDSYSLMQGQTLSVPASGVLSNDIGGSGALAAFLVTGVSHGNLALSTNGSFTYTPTNAYFGPDSFAYQAADQFTNSGVATVSLNITQAPLPVANSNFYSFTPNSTLSIPTPGVLLNDSDPNGSNLVAVVAANPSHGTLNLNANGSFTYTPASNYFGNDSFAYLAFDGLNNSAPATVSLFDSSAGTLFYDNFTRAADPGSLAPWIIESDSWTVTSGTLQGGPNANANTYGYAFLTNIWTNFFVQSQLQFSDTGAYGGGIGGRLNTNTGAHYAAWVFPEGSGSGAHSVLKLIKFSDWTDWGYNSTAFQPMASVPLLSVGTSAHTLKLAFQGPQISVYYDGTNALTATDTDTTPGAVAYTNGSVDVEMFTDGTPYVLTVDDYTVSTLAVDDSYSVTGTNTLSVSAPGVLTNDTEMFGGSLTASLVSNATNGTLTLNANGSFTYLPTNSAPYDSFSYRAVDGSTNVGTATASITHVLLGQTISFGALANKTYGAAPISLSATASSGLPVAFSVFSGPATITNTTLTITGAGSVTVQASQPGNAAYASAPSVFQSFTVNPAPLGVTANSTNRLYGATNPVFTALYTGLVNGDTAASLGGNPSLTCPATTNSTVGGYTITAGVGTISTANYAISFTNGTLTVNKATLNVNADAKTRLYGQTNPPLTVSYFGFVNNENTSVLSGSPNVNTTATTNSPIGSYTITVGQGSLTAANYTFAPNNGTLTVNRAILGVTANSTNRLYGTTNPVFTASYSGFVNNETTSVLSGSPSLTTTAVSNSPVGSYTITAGAGTLSANNYSFTTTNGTLTIGQASLLVSADNQSRAYGATNPVLTYSFSGFQGTDTVAVVSGAAGTATAATTNSIVGSYPITVANINLAATNYTFNFTNGTLIVNKAPLGVTANPTNRLYGATNPVFTASYSGFVNGDTAAVLSGTPSLTTTATTNSIVGNYSIIAAAGSLTATNYSFAFFTNGNLAINQATLLVSADNKSRPFGVTNPVLTYSISGFLNNDTAAVVSGVAGTSTAAVSNSPSGTYPITVTNINLSATNYSFGFSNGVLTVGQAVLLVSADPQSRVYGATNPVLTYTISGFQGTDTVAIVSGSAGTATAATTNSSVGTYAITVTNINLSASNYSFAFTNGQLTVSPASLLVSADNQSRVYGATNPVLTYSFSGFSNADNSSVVSGAAGTATTATTNAIVGTYPITVTNINLSATNYTFAFTNGTLMVNPATLLVSADNKSRVYGAANPALTYSFSGFANADTASVVSGIAGTATAAGAGSTVGNYPITVTNINLSATNYNFAFTNGTLQVTTAALLVSADNQSRPYGATNPVLTYAISGFQGTDTVAVVSGAAGTATAATTNSNVGTYSITVTNINLSATNYSFNFTNGTLTVNPISLLIAANPTNRTYGATNPPFTFTASGFAGTDTVAVLGGSPSFGTTATTNSTVGTYPISITNGSLSATNYTFAFSNNVLTVNPASLLVSADNQVRPYGATNPVLTYTISGFAGTDTVAVVSGVAGTSTIATTNSANGTYPITVTNISLSASNYNFAFSNGVLTVGQAVLLVTADSQSRTYGATNPLLTYTISGFQGTDTVAVVSGTAGTATAATTNSNVGAYPITVTNINLSASNYVFNFTNGTLTVNPATLTVTASNQARLYGALNPALTYGFAGFSNNDTATVVSGIAGTATPATTNSNVGTYPITVTNINLSATNYSFNFTNGTLTVNPISLLIAANPTNRIYGVTNPLLTFTASGFAGTDTVAVLSGSPSLSTTAQTNSPVGPYPIAITNGSLGATNYTFSFSNNVLNVNPATLLVSANPKSRPYGATNPMFTYTISGFAGTDTVAVVSGAAGASTTATTNSPVGMYPIAITNIDLAATNYNFTFSNSTLTIGQAALLVSADSQARLYGSANPVLTYTISGFQGTDTVAVVSGAAGTSTAATTFSPVGAYPINVTNINLSATNYSFLFTNGSLAVNPATLQVTADNQIRPYGASNPALTYSFSGFLGSDTVAVVSGAPSVSTSASNTSPVGTYPITITNGNLSATNYLFAFSNGTLSVVASQPTILSITGVGTTNVVLTWSALSNVTYRVQYNSDLTMTNWQSLTPDILATNTTASATDHPTNAPVRFYRLFLP